jgi:signal transduction histidine kinase
VLVLALTRQVLEGELGARLIAVAQATAATLPVDRLVLLARGDEQSRTYGHLRDRLTAMQKGTGAARVRVVDAHLRLWSTSDDGGHVGEPVPALQRDAVELQRVLAGVPQASTVLFRGQDGQLYKTGYAPVLDEDGKVVGAVSVDASAAFFAPLQTLRVRLLGLGFLAAGLLALAAFLLGRALVQPVHDLVSAARRIGKGDLESPVDLPRGDELGVLATNLEQMRQGLLARDRQLQMMLAGVAHEVRNPLGGMELYAGLLEEDLGDRPQQLELLGKIQRELDYLKVLVDDFLDFARNKPLQREPLDLAALVKESAELARPFLAARGLGLVLEGADGAMQVQGDPAALRRVLLNLLKNAAEASPEKGAVNLIAEQRGGVLSIMVADQGPGVPAASRETIFEPFFTTKEKGTGLGLAFARKLIEAHGGTLELAQVGPGARFVITLPWGEAVVGKGA